LKNVFFYNIFQSSLLWGKGKSFLVCSAKVPLLRPKQLRSFPSLDPQGFLAREQAGLKSRREWAIAIMVSFGR
jgi:hypothetical protein